MFFFPVIALVIQAALAAAQDEQIKYGADCSFPIHHNEFRCGDLLGDRKAFYDHFLEGCRKNAGRLANRCDYHEKDRMESNIKQTQSMVNYTNTGFMKIRAPKAVMELLTSHWSANRHNEVLEDWGPGNVYANHWESPSYMTSVEDSRLRGGGEVLKDMIWEAARSTIEQWTGMEQKPISLYGIRKYTTGAVLNPHVDRMPLVSSCIVNVDQDVDEPWPLEVYDRHGNAVNVTMQPGDMVLYESGSLIHGRPFPLKGRFFANIFIHFEPTGRKLGDTTMDYLDELDDFYPPYFQKGSPILPTWKKENPGGWKKTSPAALSLEVPSPEAHVAAAQGDVTRLATLAREDVNVLHKKDANGWLPVHEAARGGHTDAIQLLVEHGADIHACTGDDDDEEDVGFSPLDIAIEAFGEDHAVVRYLQSLGAGPCFDDEL